MRKGVGWEWILLLAAAGWAQEPSPEEGREKEITTVRPYLDRILAPLENLMARRPPPEDAGYRMWADEYEGERQRAVRKTLATIRFHGPGGEGKRLDIGPACEALLGPLLAPPGEDEARKLAEDLLRLDPQSPACWSLLRALLARFRVRCRRGEASWEDLFTWADALRRASGIDGEAALAVELLLAHVCYEMGDRQRARDSANVVVTAEAGSADLRRDARRLRSLTSLLPPGRDAPSFRIAALDGSGEIRLEDFRGRSVLLHFWYVADPDDALASILWDCHDDLTRSELVIVTVPLFDGAAPPGNVARLAEPFDWPVAAANHVAQDAGRAYGAEGISALVLISPDGRVMKSDGWEIGGATRVVHKLVTEAAGPPLDTLLPAVHSWAECRVLWHDLLARHHVRFAAETWERAQALGPCAYGALLLASTGDREATERPPPGDDLHGRLVAAWRKSRLAGDHGDLDALLAPLSRTQSDECLAVVDALFDLGLMGEEVRVPLERVAERSPRWEAASMALRAIHFCDTEDSPQGLRRLLKHKRWQVRLALAEALRAYRHKHAVDLLIQLLGDKRLRVRSMAEDHLELLTGESLGQSQKAWGRWRSAQGSELQLRPREISVYRPFRPSDRKYAHKDYYGLHVASDRLVFVLDKSESMYYGLFDGVIEEMQAHLESAGPTTKFNVIEFAETPKPWQSKLVAANAANVSQAVAFLKRDMPYGPTNVVDSLRLAMRDEEMDAIILLSDGLPNRGDPSEPRAIIEAIAKENRYTRLAIHTVLLLTGRAFPHDAPRGAGVPPPDGEELKRREEMREWAPTTELGSFLEDLAARNDGTFGIGFADSWLPPPGAKFRPGTDK